jgi:tRNA pseudouridine38-40 synthase
MDGSVRFAIKLAYDGTDYQGFQAQAHGNTIQDQIEARLEKMVRRPLRIFGWGRTDSGVHARGAVITVDLTHEEVERLALARKERGAASGDLTEMSCWVAKSLHSALREFACQGGLGSITALSAVPVPSDFDPRFSSLWKRYVYFISCGVARSPFLNRYAWQMDRILDFERMVQAAAVLSGEHNFRWMSVSQEGELRDPVRNLSLTVERVDSGHFNYNAAADHGTASSLIKISGTCDFFLYRMMRRVVGILVGVGTGRIGLDILQQCVIEQDGFGATKTGYSSSLLDSALMARSIPAELQQTAPAKGLCLEHVEYDTVI